tara:strand:- start:437 stop:2362 length:1926 start_codon:yes stop_codon:yes gene_type:complete
MKTQMKLKKGGWIDNVDKEMKKKGTVGAFTKQAKKAGMSVHKFAKKVIDNPKDFTERTRKRAQLALTFEKISKDRKFKKETYAKGGEVGFFKSISEDTLNPYYLFQQYNNDDYVDDNVTLLNGTIDLKFKRQPKSETKPSNNLPYEVKRIIEEDFEYVSYGEMGSKKSISLRGGSWGDFYIGFKNLTLNELQEIVLPLSENVAERLEEKGIKGYGELGLNNYGQSVDIKVSEDNVKENDEYAEGGEIKVGDTVYTAVYTDSDGEKHSVGVVANSESEAKAKAKSNPLDAEAFTYITKEGKIKDGRHLSEYMSIIDNKVLKGGSTYAKGGEIEIKTDIYTKENDYGGEELVVYQHPTRGVWITSENGDVIEHSKGVKGKKEVDEFVKQYDWELQNKNEVGYITLEDYAKGGGVDGEYEIYLKGWSVEQVEDSWGEGETGEVVGYHSVSVGKKFGSKKELYKYVEEDITYQDANALHFIYMGDGDLRTDVLVNEGNDPASPLEIASWKKGDKRLYNAHYVLDLEVSKKVKPLSDEEVAKVLGAETYFKKGGKIKDGYIRKDRFIKLQRELKKVSGKLKKSKGRERSINKEWERSYDENRECSETLDKVIDSASESTKRVRSQDKDAMIYGGLFGIALGILLNR